MSDGVVSAAHKIVDFFAYKTNSILLTVSTVAFAAVLKLSTLHLYIRLGSI